MLEEFIAKTKAFALECSHLGIPDGVEMVYNPLEYAFASHEAYLRKFANGQKRFLYLGMNPGPWGMAQTGIPFGEIPAVKDWMGLQATVNKPTMEHPARPIEGYDCKRSEVSGRRLWGFFKDTYGSAESFFSHSFVLNYCPLSFMSVTGANITPDKLPAEYRKDMSRICDNFLFQTIEHFQPELAIGVGGYAEKCFVRVCKKMPEAPRISKLLHPSPASPIANKHWPVKPREQLIELGVLT